uniref:ascorbate ferrireductase (transmembrane) n=1 Tax=Caenorhabditis japonica TaxID=281687 RepID=A0A8R1DKC0_CAEJA
MVHDLEMGAYHLLFARGSANKYTLEKDIHSTNDGTQFPWMSDQQVSFCRTNCSSPNLYHIGQMRQTYNVSRYWRYRIAVWHGILLMFAWWVLCSTAILISRYFKPLFPRNKLLGTAVWFQLHRDMMILSVIIQVICVIFIFYQAGWVWYQCSYMCTSDDFAKKMHAITGFTATVLALLQPIFGFLRPSPTSSIRPFFNWGHWFLGMFSWSVASATIILALPMGKTGLNRLYGHAPNWIVLAYILFFIACNLVLEIITITSNRNKIEGIQPHRFTVGPMGMALANVNTPIKDAPVEIPKRTKARVAVVVAHLIVSMGVTIAFAVMLFKALWSHSP